jgi:hypothetical protein
VPTPGLSLIGFMPQAQAEHYLATECVPANASPTALAAEWHAAVARLGTAPTNAGHPTIRNVPASHTSYVAQLTTSPSWQPTFAANPTWQVKMVEAAPLLAFQHSILTGKSAAHCAGFSSPPTLDELLEICLPLVPVSENFHVVQQAHSVLIRARSLNLRPMQVGPIGPGAFGLQVGVGLPFVHVVRYNGQCYIHNGYHRAYGAALAGAVDIPCIFRDVTTPQEAGIQGPPATFDLPLLCSSNPPTLHHFVAGQAHPVQLIEKTRVMHISWSDWIAPEF